LDAKSDRDDSAGSSDTSSLALGSIFYTKPPGVAQGGNQKSYSKGALHCTTGFWGLAIWASGIGMVDLEAACS
jgi:hypothetical protein